MLQIKNLTITHRKDLRIILDNFSFVLGKGDKAVIIGEEGNGKSTLIKLIYDEKLVMDYVEYKGDIIKNNAKLGYLSQELTKEQKNLKVYEYFSRVPDFYDLTPKELSDIAYMLGISSDFFYSDQMVGELSGGEKVKLQFAGIFVDKADILLLDEPSNDIDLDTLTWLEQFIQSCELPILYVSHDETLIENTANIIIHIEQIKRKTLSKYTIAKMPYTTYIKERVNKYTHQEQVARKERSDFEKQQEIFRKIQQKVEHQQNVISRQNPSGGRLLKKKMHTVKAMERRFEKEYETMIEIPEQEDAIFAKFDEKTEMPSGKKILELALDELTIQGKTLARNISLRVSGRDKVCIIGKNGTGKTTLIKIIAEHLLVREDIKAAYMPQNYEDLLDLTKTPIEFLKTIGDKDEISRIRTYLGSMKFTADEMSHAISQLSGGQKAKILFLKMSLDGCNVLILDEPTRNFSPLSNPVIRNILRLYKGTIISISHDRKYIEDVCTTVYTLTKDGLIKNEM